MNKEFDHGERRKEEEAKNLKLRIAGIDTNTKDTLIAGEVQRLIKY